MSFPLIAIVGPTASGKSALALQIARQVGGEIVGCDAMQVYRHCDIVTAKPSASELASVPHHLIDVCDPDQSYSAAQWAQHARLAIAEIRARGRVPIVCGGTGFYLRALLEPERISAPAPDDALRAALQGQLDEEGVAPLLRQLHRLNPTIAQGIEPNDGYRVVRALQIALQRARGDEVLPPPAPLEAWVYALQWPRAALYERINARVDAMLEQGALDETRELLHRWGREAAWASGVGYRQLIGVLEEGGALGEATEHWKRESRRYAKRQQTWFRHQTEAVWLDATRGAGELVGELIAELAPGDCAQRARLISHPKRASNDG